MRFPAIDTFATGHLPVTDGNEIYWEASGNPKGQPALYLHGGPGSGIMTGYRRHFDPEKFLIISFEQRGCGRSRPLATDPGVDLSKNTTHALISDIEILRAHFNVESWLLFGASWGTTLALAYAQAHPNRVQAMVLAAVTTTSHSEVNWITEQMRRIFPQEWDQFQAAVQATPGQRLIDVYYQHLTHADPKIREHAAKAWCTWEDVHMSLDPKSKPTLQHQTPEFRLLFATLVVHYWKHAAFIEGDGLLVNMHKISHIPAVLIHGRLDVSSPLEVAWDLHKSWPSSELIVVNDDGHGGESMVIEVDRAVARLSQGS